MKQAVKLEGGSNQHLRLEDVENPCLVDFDKCPHGMSLSFWAQFGEIEDGMYYLSSKNLQVFCYLVFPLQNQVHEKKMIANEESNG